MTFKEIMNAPLTQKRIDNVVAYLSKAGLPLNARKKVDATK